MHRLALSLFACSLLATSAVSAPNSTGTIVQTGSLSGGGAPGTQAVVLDAFDDQDGTLELDAVGIQVRTSVIGGCMTNGSGVPTRVQADLVADVSLGARPLVATLAQIDAVVTNSGPPVSLTFFGTDDDAIVLRRAADLAPWVGTGRVTLDAFTSFSISEDPPGSVSFSAGGSVHWTVTYSFRRRSAEQLAAAPDGARSGGVARETRLALALERTRVRSRRARLRRS